MQKGYILSKLHGFYIERKPTGEGWAGSCIVKA